MFYKKIIIPTQPHPDTIVAIFLLKKFGEEKFPGIKEAQIEIKSVITQKETEENLAKQGILILDLGGGKFDHHNKKNQTLSDLVADDLEIKDDPALTKLLQYARRDDIFGKGIISTDLLDRAFGLSALIANLNKSLIGNPNRVVDIILPILTAHYNEEERRTKLLPRELEKKIKSEEVLIFEIKSDEKKIKIIMIKSDNPSMAGYLKSQIGGKFDIVVQCLSSGHINILTRPTKRINLKGLAAAIRLKEAEFSGINLEINANELMKYGRLNEAPQWYYDPATNSLLNGGLNPQGIESTKIKWEDFSNILKIAFSKNFLEKLFH
ncbi:MAG: hypothetical protein A3H02_01360 [Candidatus Niyogibacteria bacterium RIFCSPLOWO2_12_FULL_41_13]|uniref:Uncharacterized protein n=1 Tax=Candidatus Niyogibacteria bacterium RIFCSPLOWO2_12_FULL_41_13 TaxID=1801726 RepID=A0A1G2F0V4_9BACT|nr:MAG: hypothetical protein A3H02_01360 [Candidatus Niyogibacteria bacterium RIFCSPLOWO2_12_FULL_41_13]